IFCPLAGVQHVTTQAEYTPDIAAIDLPQCLDIVAPCALYYALKIQPLHLLGLAFARLWSLRLFLSAYSEAVRSRSNKVTQILGDEREPEAGRLAIVVAGFELPTLCRNLA